MQLNIHFAYSFNASGAECVVLDAFLPDNLDGWQDNLGRRVTHYPFLVITETAVHVKGAWLPYWHIVGSGNATTKKFGQWAPSMDLSTFAQLVEKAQAKGYLK